MSDDLFTNSDANADSSAGFASPLSTGPASNAFDGSTAATLPSLTAPTFDAAKSLEAMQRVRDLNIKPFGDNPPPTVLTPNMLALTPQLADKYPDIYNPTLFAKSMDTYGPRWGLDRATVLKTASNTAGGENQGAAATPPQTGQENTKRPDEDFTHNGVGYYRRNGQLYSAGSDDPNLELKVTPEVEAKIMKERAERQPSAEERQRSEALKQRIENYSPQWEENAMPGSDNHDFLDGFFAMPDGNNPYEGKNLMQQAGRFTGSVLLPIWDDGRQTIAQGYGIWNKYHQGQEVTSADFFKLGEHAMKSLLDITAINNANRIYNTTSNIARGSRVAIQSGLTKEHTDHQK